MVDERGIADRRLCPDCGAELSGGVSCGQCGLPLRGPAAEELWRVSVDASRLLQRRQALIAALREGTADSASAVTHPATARQESTVRRRPGDETPRAIQNWLLTLGVLLFGVAAVIFVTVAWGRLGIGGRAAVMAGVTALAGGSVWIAYRRALRATAESLVVLTAVLTLLDAFALRAYGLFGLDAVPGEPYWACATAVIAVLLGAASALIHLTAARLASALLFQVPLLLMAVYWAGSASQPEVAASAVTGSQVILLTVTGSLLSQAPALRDVRLVMLVSTLPTWFVALAAALLASYGDDPSLLAGCLLAAGLAGVAALAGLLNRHETWPLFAAAMGAAAAALLAVWAPIVEYAPDQWQTTGMSAVHLAGAGAAFLSAARWRRPAIWTCDAMLAVAALTSWTAIADPEIVTPEAYTAPAGAALLVVGYVRHRREGDHGSWAAYGPGLALLLVPSLVAAVIETGPWRPLLLGLAALAVLLIGVARRLQAPLVLGGLTVAVDALAQLAPYLEALYEAVPRWVVIAAVGLLLVATGVTYEKRLRDVRRVRESLTRMN